MDIILEPINKKKTVVDQVIERLINHFLQGSLKLGDRLPPEMEMARQLNTSRNSMREAMKVLEVLGIVERRQGDGSYIASDVSFSLAPMLFALLGNMGTSLELVELRQMLEVGLIDLVVEKIDNEGIVRIEEALIAMKEFSSTGQVTVEKLLQHDLRFHYAIIECSNNASIVKLAKLLMQLFYSSMAEHLASAQGIKRTIEDHEAIFKAIKMRDHARARQTIINSFKVWKKYVRVPDKKKSKTEK